ncbi:MAG: hypothetical protein LBR47_05380, partial [Spirochaetaceae bacterium]|nr:hypothetical protein [Spirochaetaceae bacterium]
MTHIHRKIAVILFILPALAYSLGAAGPDDNGIVLKKIALFSSGVGFFEHSGTASGDAELTLPFDYGAVNDVLKSLVIRDPGTVSPSVSYPSEQTHIRTLRSLSIDLSGNPGIADILGGLRGAEVQIYAPTLITGRIM